MDIRLLEAFRAVVESGSVTHAASSLGITQPAVSAQIARLVNAGIYVLDPDVVARVPRGQPFPITSLFADALGRGEAVGGFEIVDEWIDIGSREQLRAAREGTTRCAGQTSEY